MITTILIILGLCFGSFVNALVWRLYQQSQPKKKRTATDEELSISKGRSMCPHCRHTLTWYDLIPVLSWVSLRGRCRYCKQPISWQYPIVELITAALFVASYTFWPTSLTSTLETLIFGLWLSAVVMFVALIIYDIRWMLLPNKIVFPLIGLGGFITLIRAIGSDNPIYTLLLALGGLVVAGGLFYVLFQISDGKWIGGGDVKLGFALGLILGSPILAFMMLFFASILGLFVALPSVLRKESKVNAHIPFGPFLITATIIVMLFGQDLARWYGTTFLYL